MSGAPQFPAERLISPPNSALARCGYFPGTTLDPVVPAIVERVTQRLLFSYFWVKNVLTAGTPPSSLAAADVSMP